MDAARILSALEAVGLQQSWAQWALNVGNYGGADQALREAHGRLIGKLADRREAVLAKVKELPAVVPTSAEGAIREKRLADFEALQQLGDEWALLDRAHRALIEPLLGAPEKMLVYADTRRHPVGGGVVPVGPPVGSLARLAWLATPEAQAWTPTFGEAADAMREADLARGGDAQMRRGISVESYGEIVGPFGRPPEGG
jgi:hypothetical protein